MIFEDEYTEGFWQRLNRPVSHRLKVCGLIGWALLAGFGLFYFSGPVR